MRTYRIGGFQTESCTLLLLQRRVSDDSCSAGLSAGEFVAHSGAVNCVRIGRSTAGVLATGGEDKKVNLWRTGQTEVVKVGGGSLCRLNRTVPHPARATQFPASTVALAPAKSNPTPGWVLCCVVMLAQSLCGLQSSVECVVFGEKEDTIAAGGANGTVKVWDMETGKGRWQVAQANNPFQQLSPCCLAPSSSRHLLSVCCGGQAAVFSSLTLAGAPTAAFCACAIACVPVQSAAA